MWVSGGGGGTAHVCVCGGGGGAACVFVCVCVCLFVCVCVCVCVCEYAIIMNWSDSMLIYNKAKSIRHLQKNRILSVWSLLSYWLYRTVSGRQLL